MLYNKLIPLAGNQFSPNKAIFSHQKHSKKAVLFESYKPLLLRLFWPSYRKYKMVTASRIPEDIQKTHRHSNKYSTFGNPHMAAINVTDNFFCTWNSSDFTAMQIDKG